MAISSTRDQTGYSPPATVQPSRSQGLTDLETSYGQTYDQTHGAGAFKQFMTDASTRNYDQQFGAGATAREQSHQAQIDTLNASANSTRLSADEMSANTRAGNAATATANGGNNPFVIGPGTAQQPRSQLDQNISDNFNRNRDNPAEMSRLMRQYGISNDQFRTATGQNQQQFDSYFAPVFGGGGQQPGANPGGSPGASPAPAPSPSSGTAGSTGSFNLSSGTGMQNFGAQPITGPTDWNVDSNQTVASQLERIIAGDSPLMQRARMQARQEANARGLSNSSMAATAGEAAVIDRAMPIAQQDARTYGDAAQTNAGAHNTFARDGNQFSRDRSMADFNLAANDWAADRTYGRSQNAADAEYRRGQSGADAEFTRTQSGADRNLTREQTLAGTRAGYTLTHDQAIEQQRSDLQRGNESTRSATEQANTLHRGYINSLNQARTDYAAALGNVSSSSTMTTEVKAETLRNLRTTYNTIIRNYSQLLGWDANSWTIGDEPTSTSTTATPAPAPAESPGQTGGSQ